MNAFYHRRPHVDPADVAAISVAKLGSGSVWQGLVHLLRWAARSSGCTRATRAATPTTCRSLTTTTSARSARRGPCVRTTTRCAASTCSWRAGPRAWRRCRPRSGRSRRRARRSGRETGEATSSSTTTNRRCGPYLPPKESNSTYLDGHRVVVLERPCESRIRHLLPSGRRGASTGRSAPSPARSSR